MKKIYVICATLIIGAVACQKTEIKPTDRSKLEGVSSFEESQVNKYKKEIVVYDESNKNNVMLALHSDDMEEINKFINTYDIVVNTSFSLDNSSNGIDEDRIPNGDSQFNEGDNLEPKLTIELVSQNIESNEKYFSLNFKSKAGTKLIIPKAPVGFMVKGGNAIGVVHRGQGYINRVKYRYKKHFASLWKDYYAGNVNAWHIHPGAYSYYNYWDYSIPDPHKVNMLVYQDYRQNYINYEVFYSLNSGYSQQCALGTYNTNNYGECYYGSVPEGSSPFIYNYGGAEGTWFLYTPINNTCPWLPEAESGFDTQNCKVVKIPSDRVGKAYTWQRDLLTKSYSFSEL